MALRRRRRALSPWPLLAALHAIVLEGMLDRQADPIGPRADPIRLHGRTLRRHVLRRTGRARDVLNLILRHVGREIRHVPEDAEDLLVPQADVVEKRDDRETAHVRDVLVVLDLREEIVHARWEPRDAHLPDVLRLEGRLLRLEDAPDLPKIRATGYARSCASWSAGAMATRSEAAPRSSASRTRAFPRLRARANAGSSRISSRLTFSARMNADDSRRNGYLARVASSTSEGTSRGHKRPTRGTAKREKRIPWRCVRRKALPLAPGPKD